MAKTQHRWVGLVSVNDHLVPPPDLFQSRLPAKHQERGPRVVDAPPVADRDLVLRYGLVGDADYVSDDEPQPGHAWLYDGGLYPTSTSSIIEDTTSMDFRILRPFRYEDIAPRFYDPVARLEPMDADGVVASACFPMQEFPGYSAQLFGRTDDKELALAVVRAYNDYVLEEWAAAAPDRLVPVVSVPMWDPDASRREIERVAAKGARAITFPEDPFKLGHPSIHDDGRPWDAAFAAAAEAGMPLCLHMGSASWLPPAPRSQPLGAGYAAATVLPVLALYDWMMNGVFERVPGLTLVLPEGEAGWIPHALDRLDYVWHRHRHWTGTRVPNPPRTYFADHVFGCVFSYESFALAHLADIGVDNVVMNVDYPHPDTSYPRTREETTERLAHLSDEDFRKVTCGNAERVFGFKAPEPTTRARA